MHGQKELLANNLYILNFTDYQNIKNLNKQPKISRQKILSL